MYLHKNCKTILAMFSILLGLSLFTQAFGQKFTGSPYSQFGIGEVAKQGTARNKAMGNTGIALRDKEYLNTLNPASYTTLDSTTFLFDVGVTAGVYNFKTNDKQERINRANFEYFSLGFSVTKRWAISAGIRQVTNIGYDMEFLHQDTQTGYYTTKYEGSGGVNKFYIANALKITPKLSIGVSTNFNWGEIESNKSVKFAGNRGIPYHSEESVSVSNLNFDFGLQYTGKLKEKINYVAGLTFGNKTDITNEYKSFLYKQNIYDTISYNTRNNKTIELPNSFGIGLAITKDNKLTIALDANYQAWGSVASVNTENTGLNMKLKDSYSIALGAEFIPEKYSLRKFLKRLSYRGGLYYNDTHLEINGKALKEYGFTLGVGVPIKSTYVNIAFDLGRRGTVANNLIREDFARLSLSFTLFEAWFEKRLYR